jgi:hypothetical protein
VTPIWNQLKTRLSTTKTPSNLVRMVDTNTTTTSSEQQQQQQLPLPTTTTTTTNDNVSYHTRPSEDRTTSTDQTTTTTTTMMKMIQEMDEIITHELIHIYDVRQLQLNLIHCNDLAYSEIRAAREAECSQFNTTTTTANTIIMSNNNNSTTTTTTTNNNIDKYQKQHKQQYKQWSDCVRTRATTATKNIFPSYRAHQCIQNVYTTAMADLRPFSSSSPTTTTTLHNHHHHQSNTETSSTMEDPYVSKK